MYFGEAPPPHPCMPPSRVLTPSPLPFPSLPFPSLPAHAALHGYGARDVDSLAAEAAWRAAELRSDTAKGAKLRKKKAVTDLLRALQDLGLSRRAADVPAGKRGGPRAVTQGG